MGATIAAALALATKVFEYLNTKESRKFIEDVKNIKLEILSEESKGYHSDDAKLEELYKRAKILIEAATAELNLNAVKS